MRAKCAPGPESHLTTPAEACDAASDGESVFRSPTTTKASSSPTCFAIKPTRRRASPSRCAASCACRCTTSTYSPPVSTRRAPRSKSGGPKDAILRIGAADATPRWYGWSRDTRSDVNAKPASAARRWKRVSPWSPTRSQPLSSVKASTTVPLSASKRIHAASLASLSASPWPPSSKFSAATATLGRGRGGRSGVLRASAGQAPRSPTPVSPDES
mmetsp:Transcript_20986/g.72278  ORF Transcript_20986/g.72278 Transcript_20986/m.72278 type:complete len:215 (-) Transcript_20986:1454-2098(-)